MIRSSIITSLILSIALITGCDSSPEGTTPPDDGGATSDADGKTKKGKKSKTNDEGGGDSGGDGDSDAGEDPIKKVCPAETADYPAPYFMDTVLIRLPKGVSEDSFIEDNPSFARLTGKIDSVSCVEGVPGATISFMALFFYQDDKAKTVTQLRDESLESLGYKGVSFSEEKTDDKARFYQGVIDVPADDQNPEPARALVQLSSANGNMYVLVMETHPNAWNALKETFRASAGKMSFLKP